MGRWSLPRGAGGGVVVAGATRNGATAIVDFLSTGSDTPATSPNHTTTFFPAYSHVPITSSISVPPGITRISKSRRSPPPKINLVGTTKRHFAQTTQRFIGLENKQGEGEAQFRAKCEKEKVTE